MSTSELQPSSAPGAGPGAAALGELVARWDALKAAEPHLRIRDAATRLGVSELELLACDPQRQLTWLTPAFDEILYLLPTVGRVMALTRNEDAVSEVKGTYGGVELGAHAGQVIGEDIDLRVFLTRWRHGVAVVEPGGKAGAPERHSLHFFDEHGAAVHKIYLQPEGALERWQGLVASYRAAPPSPLVVTPAPRPAAPPAAGLSEERAEAFRAAWAAMTDTHELFGLLRGHGLTRTQALELVQPRWARRVGNHALAQLLGRAADEERRIMTFIGNLGCIQIFSGTVKRIVRSGPWLNVMDPGHNLHLREDHVAASWVVHKPSRHGLVGSLELYNAAGETIVQVFRKRKDQESAEDEGWMSLLASLEAAP
jgi:putative hemin transport protein